MSGLGVGPFTGFARRSPVCVAVLVSGLGFALAAVATGLPTSVAELLRALSIPAFASWLGVYLLTKGMLGSLTAPLASVGTVMLAAAADRYLRGWSEEE